MVAVGIDTIGVYVPPRIVTNDELSQCLDTSDEWIRSHTGIGTRHIVAEGVTASDLAVAAFENMCQRFEVAPDAIEALIVATATAEYRGFPSTACLVQDRLGLTNVAAFDISAGCTGFIYALELARSLVAGGSFSQVLAIGAETFSTIVDWRDRNTAVLFGDGAGCTLVRSNSYRFGTILDSLLLSQGSGGRYLCVPAKADDQFSADQLGKVVMNGRAVYNFAVEALQEVIKTLLTRNHLQWEELDWIIPHQANSRIISAAANRMGVGEEKFFLNIERYANTSAASIPLAMAEMIDCNLLQKGHKILTVGFGAGLTYGGNYIQW